MYMYVYVYIIIFQFIYFRLYKLIVTILSIQIFCELFYLATLLACWLPSGDGLRGRTACPVQLVWFWVLVAWTGGLIVRAVARGRLVGWELH